jgi:ATP-binding cassette subfamily B protein
MEEQNQIQSGNQILEPMKTIEFVNVSFVYPDSKQIVLNNLSFCIHAGERIAFAGLNGAGKSTIIKLLFRLYDPTSGTILYNGKDIRLFELTQYRKQFSAMLQDSTVYSLSLKDNVTMSDCDRKENDKEIVDILNRSGLNVNIEDLNLRVGKDFSSDGIILSKGQAQSLHLARLLYKNSAFCVFDEPASNLDATVEKQLFDQIFSNFSSGQTIILISHRLCNLKKVDKIIFIENGKNIETGTHDQLIANMGEYYKLYQIQAERY